MIRLLVLGVLLALVQTVRADAPARCKPLEPRTIPAERATDLPLNARVWQLGGSEGFYEYTVDGDRTITVQSEVFDRNEDHPVFTYPLRELRPNARYWLSGSGPRVSIDTSSRIDRTPPAMPLVSDFEIELAYQPTERMPVAALRFTRQVSEDTVLLRIVITDAISTQTITTTPDQTNLCSPGLRLAPGPIQVSIEAIDIAGNSSADHGGRWFRSVRVADPTTRDPRGHYGMNCVGPFLYLGPALLCGVVLLILLALSLRHWRGADGDGEAISLLVADHIARRVLRRASSGSVAVIVGFASAWWLDNGLLAFLVGLIACVPLSALVAARRVLRELDGERARAELRDTVLIVRSACGQARLATSQRVIEHARRHAVPVSTAL